LAIRDWRASRASSGSGLPGRIPTRFSLRPVAFRYKKEIDPAAIQQFGLVAEDVGKVNPDLVVRDTDGKAYTVRYRANHAMLLNEFLKEHRTVQELRNEIAALTAIVKD
jgi:Chaperone of endosialidase